MRELLECPNCKSLLEYNTINKNFTCYKCEYKVRQQDIKHDHIITTLYYSYMQKMCFEEGKRAFLSKVQKEDNPYIESSKSSVSQKLYINSWNSGWEEEENLHKSFIKQQVILEKMDKIGKTQNKTFNIYMDTLDQYEKVITRELEILKTRSFWTSNGWRKEIQRCKDIIISLFSAKNKIKKKDNV